MLSDDDDVRQASCARTGERRGREQCLRDLEEFDGDTGEEKSYHAMTTDTG